MHSKMFHRRSAEGAESRGKLGKLGDLRVSVIR
jgi:hypothetical protein